MNTKLLTQLVFFFLLSAIANAQEILIKKGIVVDSININEKPEETFSLFLPENFENKGTWPLLVVVDSEGQGKKALLKFVEAGREKGYIMAASNAVHDSLELSENVQRVGRLFSSLSSLFPLNKNRLYVAGYEAGGRLANVLPIFFKNLTGIISCGATLNNVELISAKNPYHFIGIVGREDFTYRELLQAEEYFNKLKFDNNILVFEGGKEWPPRAQLAKALNYLTLRAMAKGTVVKDSIFIEKTFKKGIAEVRLLQNNKELLLAQRELKEIQNAFRDLIKTDSVENAIKDLKKDKLFRLQKRRQSEAFFKESFLIEDYQYYLDEDVKTYNYNNLGWWKYQMEELRKLAEDDNIEQRKMTRRLVGYVNAIVDDSIDFNQISEDGKVDDEALLFLNMLKTITAPEAFDAYLNVISLSAKYEDYGTSIFYLEELLKKGFKDIETLYQMPNTALLKISPEFNAMVDKYLDSSRFEIKER